MVMLTQVRLVPHRDVHWQVLTLAANGGWDLCSAEEAAARAAASQDGDAPQSAGTGGSSD